MVKTIRPQSARAFTLVELMLGLLIVTMVMAALATLSLAVSNHWQETADVRTIDLQAAQTTTLVERLARSCAYTGTIIQGSPALSAAGPTTAPSSDAQAVFWMGDVIVSDGHIEPAEMLVIQYSSADQKLYAYQALPLASMTAQQQTLATTPLPPSAITDAPTIAAFENTAYIQRRTIGENVTGASFSLLNSGSTTTLPTLEFSLSFNRDGRQILQYGTVSLRAQVVPQ